MMLYGESSTFCKLEMSEVGLFVGVVGVAGAMVTGGRGAGGSSLEGAVGVSPEFPFPFDFVDFVDFVDLLPFPFPLDGMDMDMDMDMEGDLLDFDDLDDLDVLIDM